MKTFKEANGELLNWLREENDKIDKTPNDYQGRDGPLEEKRREVFIEYKRRYAELKKEYERLALRYN